MSAPKKATHQKVKHEQSNSLSSTTEHKQQYFNRSSMTNVNATMIANSGQNGKMKGGGTNGKNKNGKATKMGSLKKWFSRFGNNNNKTDEQKAHNDIEKRIQHHKKLENTTMSMLLLGAGGSGKSTVLKQMEKIHSQKYNDEEKTLFNAINEVHKNITLDIYDLCKYYYQLKQKDTQQSIQFESSDIENLAIKIATTHDPIHNNKLTKEFANDIELLWNTKTMKTVYEIRKKSHIMDNTPYFLDNVQHFANPNCIVTFDDFVRIRDQTTGIIQTEFFVENGRNKWLFKITDVGGQRAERRKWLHVFAGVDVVIYVMSLSAYDQVLYEDHNTRCWDETLNLFEKTAANKSFKETDFIIFMNKSDIFDEKIKVIPFDTYKPDYPKDQINDGESVKSWLQQEFQTRFFNPSNRARQYNSNRYGRNNGHNGHIVYKNNNNEEEKEDIGNGHGQNGGHDNKTKRGIHFHITCATDTNQIETVVRCVQIELIRKLMSRAALL